MTDREKYRDLKKAYGVISIGFCAMILGGVCFGKDIAKIHIPEKLEQSVNELVEPPKKHKEKKNNAVISIKEEHIQNKEVLKKTISAKGYVPASYKHALKVAKDYLDGDGMSKQDLYEQLYSKDGEGLSKLVAQYAVDNVHVNWNKEAEESGQDYVDFRLVKSKHELVDQLKTADEFTTSQAKLGADKVFKK